MKMKMSMYMNMTMNMTVNYKSGLRVNYRNYALGRKVR